MAQTATRRATPRLPPPPKCTSDPRRRSYRKGARPAESPDPGPGVAPALAPLIVPHARKLPHGFLLHTDERDLLRQACDLGRRLARDGSLTLLPPEEGENVIHHLGRCWAAQHQAALETSDVHLDLDWGRPWDGPYGLLLSFYAQRTRTVYLTRFREACQAIHPRLFGSIIQRLDHVLMPYEPLFTAYDARMVHEHLHFGEDWCGELADDYKEQTGQDPDELPEAELLAWAREHGRLTPDEVCELLPQELYDGGMFTEHLLGQLMTPACDALPGITTLRETLLVLSALPAEFHADREWFHTHRHFGHVTVIAASKPEGNGFDPTHEAWMEYDEIYEGVDFEQHPTEDLRSFWISSAQESESVLLYLDCLRLAQQAVRKLWAAIEDRALAAPA